MTYMYWFKCCWSSSCNACLIFLQLSIEGRRQRSYWREVCRLCAARLGVSTIAYSSFLGAFPPRIPVCTNLEVMHKCEFCFIALGMWLENNCLSPSLKALREEKRGVLSSGHVLKFFLLRSYNSAFNSGVLLRVWAARSVSSYGNSDQSQFIHESNQWNDYIDVGAFHLNQSLSY